MANWLRKVFPNSNDRAIHKLEKQVAEIEALEPRFQAMSDGELSGQTQVFRDRLSRGETLDDLLPEAFAAVREATVRVLGKRHFPVQLMGGIVLHQGRIAEMKTGEGKTFVAPLAAYLNALPGKGVHVVTVNDYLARYHSEWMGLVYKFMGLTVSLVVPGMSPQEKRAAYAADILYATNAELGFDYLRDNMAIRKENRVQRPLHFAIVDEVDSILIDEARTPLIISGMGDKSTDAYERADQFVRRLRPGEEEDYEIDEKMHTVRLTEKAVHKAEQFFGVENLSDIENTEINHHINQALKAHALMTRDKDYIVQNNEVVIVDEFTGRLMIGRRFSDGLHQAIEAKEHVKVQEESKTLATVTIQNYFRMYKKLSGMTGTAKTEENEFSTIYGMDVVVLPTNRPMIRQDLNDQIYRTETGKFNAVVEEIIQRHEKKQPVLVGTVSVEKSELISHMLDMRGVKHVVLNAKHHAKEAEIVAQAGQEGAVTIATNMAGRGTDILLGGNPEFMAKQKMRQMDYDDATIEEAQGHAETDDETILQAREDYQKYLEQYKQQTDAAHARVVELGGLHIIGTERHESRRIDNQLRGRAGRQGDPGSSRFYISLEDDLMRLFGSERIESMVAKLGLDDETPIEFGLLSSQIENAQKRVEGRNFDTRKNVLEYDDVMNQQRELIYAQRARVLEGENVHDAIVEMLEALLDKALGTFCAEQYPEQWDLDGLLEYCQELFLPAEHGALSAQDLPDDRKVLRQRLLDAATAIYAQKEAQVTELSGDMRELERVVLLRMVDQKWMDHIDNMDQLRRGIGLRAYGQHDPVQEYQREGYEMFEEMIHSIQEDTIRLIFHVRADVTPERKQVARMQNGGNAVHQTPTAFQFSGGATAPAQPTPAPTAKAQPVKVGKKIGRNDPCPCGSGKKYKNCCGRNQGEE